MWFLGKKTGSAGDVVGSALRDNVVGDALRNNVVMRAMRRARGKVISPSKLLKVKQMLKGL